VIDPLARVSVRIKLALLFVSLCLLAYGLGGSLVSRWTETALEGEILARLDFQCRMYATTLDASLRLLERRLEDFASDGYIRDHAAAMQAPEHDTQRQRLGAELRRHLSQNKLPLVDAYVNLAVTAADGALLATIHDDEPRRIQPPAPAQLGEATHAGGMLGNTGSHPGLLLSTPLRHLDGERIVGHLHVLVEADAWLREAMAADADNSAAHGMDVTLLLHDGRGRRLVATPGAGAVLRLVDDGSQALPSSSLPRFAPVRGTYARSFPVSTSGWWVEVTLGVEQALLPVSGLKSRLLGVGIVLAMLSTLLLFFPMRFVVRPLLLLSRAAERLAEGQLDTRVEVQSDDEIGDLGRSFNGMADAIEERTRRLEYTAEDLRQRQAELRAERDRVEAVIASMHDGLVVLDAGGSVLLSNIASQPLLSLIESGSLASGHHVCVDDSAGTPDPRHAPGSGGRGADGHDAGTNGSEGGDDHGRDAAASTSSSASDAPGQGCFRCLMDTSGPPRSCSVDVGPRTFEIHTTPLPPDADGGRGRVLVSREVTDRVKQDEREIHNERLAVLGEVAAVVAHEINNPLASISMFNQMLASELPDDSPLRENTDVIARNITSAKRAIRELLDYATGSTPEVGPLDVHDVLHDVLRFLRPLSERAQVSVRLEPAASNPQITGDEIQLRQVFVNLTLNAVQAVAAHAGTAPPERARTVTLRTSNQDGQLVVDVCDSGPGILPEQRQRVFRAFVTTKSRGEGTGLGLPTARRIAEMHGGSVDVLESSPEGTTFRVLLRSRAPAELPS